LAFERISLEGSSWKSFWKSSKCTTLAVNRVCEAFELVKEAEIQRFGDKSYFYRKINGLPPADSDDDPDSADDDVHAHGFEEPGGEEEVDAVGREDMDVETGDS
jgi:hypothetical protein